MRLAKSMKIELELLEIIEQQKELLQKKDELIIMLLKDNLEKENLISELMKSN